MSLNVPNILCSHHQGILILDLDVLGHIKAALQHPLPTRMTNTLFLTSEVQVVEFMIDNHPSLLLLPTPHVHTPTGLLHYLNLSESFEIMLFYLWLF